MVKISEETLNIISKSVIIGNKLYLHEELERKQYVAVNKILESIGLKWNRMEACHISEHDIGELISSIITSGEWVDEKKLNQFYETPDNVINIMLKILPDLKYDRILEPSAGNGAILKKLSHKFPKSLIDYCEISKERMLQCKSLMLPNCLPVGSNFLNFVPASKYNLIVMNPPFSRQQDIDHISHAINYCLKKGGILISVVPEGTFFRSNQKTVNFWNLVDKCSDHETRSLPEKAFKKSGTLVNTRLLFIRK